MIRGLIATLLKVLARCGEIQWDHNWLLPRVWWEHNYYVVVYWYRSLQVVKTVVWIIKRWIDQWEHGSITSPRFSLVNPKVEHLNDCQATRPQCTVYPQQWEQTMHVIIYWNSVVSLGESYIGITHSVIRTCSTMWHRRDSVYSLSCVWAWRGVV